MLNNEFGDPKNIGSAIGRAKGRFGTFLKKRGRKLSICAVVTVVLLMTVRATVAEAFYCAGHGVSPIIPFGSRVLVYKLSRSFSAGDVIAFRTPQNQIWLGIVKADDGSGTIIVTRNGQPEDRVARDRVVGRVVLNTR